MQSVLCPTGYMMSSWAMATLLLPTMPGWPNLFDQFFKLVNQVSAVTLPHSRCLIPRMTNQIRNLDFNDTFLSLDHLKASFPQYEIQV